MLAALIGAAFGISGLGMASAAPANGAVIRDGVATSTVTQNVYYRRWHRHRRHCENGRCW
jgi:hypothetical protein